MTQSLQAKVGVGGSRMRSDTQRRNRLNLEHMMSDTTENRSEIQGEGDKDAAREYNEATREFVESGKVDEAAERARGQDSAEAERAEQAGLDRAKERDPAVHRDYQKPTKD